MKTRRLMISLVVLAAVMFGSSRAWAVAVLSLQPSTTTILVGNSLSVSANISTVVDLFGYQFDIQYNPSVLSATGVTEGPFLSSGGATFFVPGTIDNITGILSFTADALVGAATGVSGNGTLATIAFTALGQGTSAISLINGELLDSTLADIAFNTTNTSITVNTPIPPKTPEPASLLLFGVGSFAIAITLKRRGVPCA